MCHTFANEWLDDLVIFVDPPVLTMAERLEGPDEAETNEQLQGLNHRLTMSPDVSSGESFPGAFQDVLERVRKETT